MMMAPKRKFILANCLLIILLISCVCSYPSSSSSKLESPKSGRNKKSSSSTSSSSICTLPPGLPSGGVSCLASFRRWTYSPELGKCEEYYYGGCFGTKNLFNSFEDCRRTCGGSGGGGVVFVRRTS